MKEIERTSVDFIVALDLSGSMLAEDAQDSESRLEAAKDGLAHFIDNLGEDRVGLIAFAGEPIVAAPVTQDHEAVKRNLAALDTKSIAKQGTDIAAAIALAEKTFATGDFESKALVILTDGEELQGDAVIAARAASAKGMSIFTVSVGSARGARIPQKERSGDPVAFARNEFGHDVLTRVNERVLRQIAANGHGFFQPLGKDGEGLQQIYDRGLQPLGRGTRLKPSKDLLDRFQWPLALAIGLFLAECIVNDRRHLSRAPRK
jgi:Ca-activated chloride channel family protein